MALLRFGLTDESTGARPAFDNAATPVTVLPHAREKLEWCTAIGIRTKLIGVVDKHAVLQEPMMGQRLAG